MISVVAPESRYCSTLDILWHIQESFDVSRHLSRSQLIASLFYLLARYQTALCHHFDRVLNSVIMFEYFQLQHIPALLAGTAMMFGGLWPLFNARDSMLEFGFPARIAETPAAAPVMVRGDARTSIIGGLMLLFYYRGEMAVVDTILAVTGAYAGLIDTYVVWKEGNQNKAIFRLVASSFFFACGYSGLTARG
jgi:hypothetical protein